MAENTRSKSTLDRLEDAIQKLTMNQTTLTISQNDLSAKVTEILSKLAILDSPSLNDSATSSHPSRELTYPNSAPLTSKHHMKLDVPRFDGTNPTGWIFKISQFFDYHNTAEEDHIRVASFYMDGDALSWFQWMFRNGQIISWVGLLQAIEMCFAPSQYDDPKGALFKLVQRGSVNEYLSEFERLANRIVGLPPHFLLSCFISGLLPEIRREVQALQPLSLLQASALARLQEDKLSDARRWLKGKGPLTPTSIQYSPPIPLLPPLHTRNSSHLSYHPHPNLTLNG